MTVCVVIFNMPQTRGAFHQLRSHANIAGTWECLATTNVPFRKWCGHRLSPALPSPSSGGYKRYWATRAGLPL